jgi:hypothetical protein
LPFFLSSRKRILAPTEHHILSKGVSFAQGEWFDFDAAFFFGSGLCVACADRIWQQGEDHRRCPLCRQPFAAVLRILAPPDSMVRSPIRT